MYRLGPGTADSGDIANSSADDLGQEDAELASRITIPTQTFIEELSQTIELHPATVGLLLAEMRADDGLVSPPELKRQWEDFVSVTVLRILGYRWQNQELHEEKFGPIVDPTLVRKDGIAPLVSSIDSSTAENFVYQRMQKDFGDDRVVTRLTEFHQWVGLNLGDWLRAEFFKRHAQQFKHRPIAWHFVSPERTFEAFVLYHKLSLPTLQALRTQYAGGLVEKLRVDLARAKERKDEAGMRKLQAQIEDVDEFRERIARIERGDGLDARIRCRWKGEEEKGRPGPYAPDIDDGVKVNIRPFQELGLLAAKVITKW